MDTITFSDKSTGQTLTAADVNEIKSVVNANAIDTWDDVVIPVQSTYKPQADPPTVGYYRNGIIYEFNTDDTIYFTIQLPHGYKVGSDVGIHFHFLISDAIADGTSYEPEFELSYNVAEINGDFNAADGVNPSSKVLAGPISEDTHMIWDMLDISYASYPMSLSSLILCKLQLIGKDGYPGTINILSVDAHVLKDTIGSSSETSK